MGQIKNNVVKRLGNEILTQKNNKIVEYIRNILSGPILWIIPNLILLVAIFIIPTISIIRFSFTLAKVIGNNYEFTLASYINMFKNPNFFNILILTVLFVFFSVLFQTLFGFLIALAIDTGEKLKLFGTVFVRVAVLVSWSIPGSIIGIIWKMLLDESPSATLQIFFSSIGIGPVAFLSTPTIAFICIVIANVWRGAAQSMILCYAGLKTVPEDLLEASQVDGANSWQRLMLIIIPYLKPVIFMNIILNVIATFNTFDMIISLTGGGPGRSTEVLALSAYKEVFKMFNLGAGSAIAVALLVINSFMAIIYFKMKKGVEN